MKRVDLLRQLRDTGCAMVRHEGKHDWYRNPRTGVSQPVPRHSEINGNLAKHPEEAWRIVLSKASSPPATRGQSLMVWAITET